MRNLSRYNFFNKILQLFYDLKNVIKSLGENCLNAAACKILSMIEQDEKYLKWDAPWSS